MESAQPCSQDQVQNTHREYDLNMDDGGRIGLLQAIPIHWCHGFFAIGLVLEMSWKYLYICWLRLPNRVHTQAWVADTEQSEYKQERGCMNPRTVPAVLSHGENNPIVVA